MKTNYIPGPLEYFHGELHNLFHQLREQKGGELSVFINGQEFNDLVAEAKSRTYKIYDKLDLKRGLLKYELE